MPKKKETLSPLALQGFYQMLRLGCYLKLIPYDWDNKKMLFRPISTLGLYFFNYHKYITYFYICTNSFRTIKAYKKGEFPLPAILITASWIHGDVLTTLVFSQFPKFRQEIMNFGNLILKMIQNPGTSES